MAIIAVGILVLQCPQLCATVSKKIGSETSSIATRNQKGQHPFVSEQEAREKYCKRNRGFEKKNLCSKTTHSNHPRGRKGIGLENSSAFRKNKDASKRIGALKKGLCRDDSQIVQKQIPTKQADVSFFF